MNLGLRLDKIMTPADYGRDPTGHNKKFMPAAGDV